jgi:hypothetical protein
MIYLSMDEKKCVKEINKVIKALKNLNKWRRGDESIEMPDPKETGLNIDIAIILLNAFRLNLSKKTE